MSDTKTEKRKGLSGNPIFKVVFIVFLVLLFLIPLSMIRHIVYERQNRSDEAEMEITALWGGRQTLAGPFVVVPYTQRTVILTDKGERTEESLSYFFLTPGDLRVDAVMTTEMRRRGIYEIPVYRTDITMTGKFYAPEMDGLHLDEKDILWKDAHVVLELPDLRSVGTGTNLSWNDSPCELSSSVSTLGLFSQNLQGDMEPGWQAVTSNSFSLNLRLQGAGGLSFIPFGNETEITLRSDWPAPSFEGAFLPNEREIIEGEGFSASWSVYALARSFPGTWKLGDIDAGTIRNASFGVSLFEPVDLYARVERSVKYGILFIILPFIAFFMMEVFSKNRIHILQYLMVGAANTVFYLLLLSLSEHLGFNAAYLAGASATTILIVVYSTAILPRRRTGLAMAPVMVGLYVFLFTVLQSEDYALLIGSVGLFVLLALVMLLTRNIDWYVLGGGNGKRRRTVGEETYPGV